MNDVWEKKLTINHNKLWTSCAKSVATYVGVHSAPWQCLEILKTNHSVLWLYLGILKTINDYI